ncbi:MAG TPA: class I SAM-dependent methyltransferase [Rhodocyclaceae bacterium]|nr:class I SAM-dependent methyltransferase [Rhodocyclaceae bacterium]
MNSYSGTDNLEVMAEAVNYNAFLLSLIRSHLRPGQRIIDIGAGIGTFARALREEGYDVLCFEPDLLQAERLAAEGLPTVTDVADLPTSVFDVAYSMNVLEHIADDLEALTQWRQLLAPKGRLLLYVPAFQCLYSSMDRKVGHFRRYRRKELAFKAKHAGFHVASAAYADSIGFVASVVYKLTRNESGSIDRKALVAYDRFLFPISRLMDRILGRVIGKNVYVIAER